MNPKNPQAPRPRVARRPLPSGSQPKVAAYDAELSLAPHSPARPAPESASRPAPESFSRPAPAAVMKGIAPALSKQELLERAYVAVAECEVEEVEPLKTCFFDTINKVKALTVANQKLTVRASQTSLAQRRGYEREDLFAIAEIAYHYLFSGGTKLALALYEGLAAVAPDEPYFALALGLTHDHLGDKRSALQWYDRARTLDPGDARPDVNTAELYLEDRDYPRAKQYLARAVTKARARNDRALERKAVSILGHLGRAA
jgi:tetratricopeptide (TPR) repeat protein